MIEFARRFYKKLAAYGKLVMFSHTIFSFSFAVVSLLLAAGGRPEPMTAVWAALAFLGARTGANALNRVIDARIDARNPRTASRQIPRGELRPAEALLLAAFCFAVMLFCAYKLNTLCLLLSPGALLLLCGYSYTKRFTWLCHLVLGFTCALAPMGAWLAVTGAFALPPLLLCAANCLWVAGFDVIYGAQDYAFDTAHGLHSIPARFGVKNALRISAGLHAAAWLLLALFFAAARPPMGLLFGVALALVAGLLIVQHAMVSPGRLAGANAASYSVSQLTSAVVLVLGVLDVYL